MFPRPVNVARSVIAGAERALQLRRWTRGPKDEPRVTAVRDAEGRAS